MEKSFMTTTAVNTPGSRLYFLDKSVSPHVVRYVVALKGFGPLGGKVKKNDKSNFDSAGYNENQPGRIDPPEATGQIILLKSDTTHQALKRIVEAQATSGLANTEWFLGDNDATSPPTVVTDHLVPPQTASPKHWARSGEAFIGYVSSLSPKYEDDSLIMADFGVQLSGKTTWYNKGDLIALTY
jgi:hypothetical protein